MGGLILAENGEGSLWATSKEVLGGERQRNKRTRTACIQEMIVERRDTGIQVQQRGQRVRILPLFRDGVLKWEAR